MEPALVSSLVNLGTGGAVIIALIYFWKLKDVGDGKVLDRLDKIVDRHLASEEASRNQVAGLAESNRNLFDRVIAVCTGLGSAIQELSTNTRANERALQELSSSTKANEKAIQDLRAEFRCISAAPQPRALPPGEAPPFGPG